MVQGRQRQVQTGLTLAAVDYWKDWDWMRGRCPTKGAESCRLMSRDPKLIGVR